MSNPGSDRRLDHHPFSASYAQARTRFLGEARAAGLEVRSHPHPLRGRDGENLAIDVVVDGDPGAAKALILSSGCHGVEGFCGSAIQIDALSDPNRRARAAAEGIVVIHIHALNPYGFSHLRRTTHENVDLNRNFLDYSKPLPTNPAYREVHPLLMPTHWPPDAANRASIARFIAARSMSGFQAAVTRGQHEFADGLFFGGAAPSWSNLTLRKILSDTVGHCNTVAWIDIHTGLGPSGDGERIFSGRDDAATLARAKAWWGPKVTSIYDGSSTSAMLTGLMFEAAYEACPRAEYTGIALEFGTLAITEVLDALRGDQWLENAGGASVALAADIKRRMLAAFLGDTDAWRDGVLAQARAALSEAIDGLAGRLAA